MAKYKVGDKVKINYSQVSKIHNCYGTIHELDKSINNLERYVVDILAVDNKNVRASLSVNCLQETSNTRYEEELTKKCLFENADALDTPFVPLKSRYTITPEGIERYDQAMKEYINKEREEKKMKEILNQKVVDLYFKRKKEVLEKEFDTIRENIKEADSNYIFIKQHNDQINEYIKSSELKGISVNVKLPLTEESVAKRDEADNDYKKKINELNNIKEEILALLSGCETYEQEMEILHTYKIVNYNSHYVNMNKIEDNDSNKTN